MNTTQIFPLFSFSLLQQTFENAKTVSIHNVANSIYLITGSFRNFDKSIQYIVINVHYFISSLYYFIAGIYLIAGSI